VFKNHVIGGTSFKVDNGLKYGFLNTMEEMLRAKLLGLRLKAVPHINFRVRHFRGDHFVTRDIIV